MLLISIKVFEVTKSCKITIALYEERNLTNFRKTKFWKRKIILSSERGYLKRSESLFL
jgi:hypothetical protein